MTARSTITNLRPLAALLGLLVVLGVFWQATALVFRPDPQDGLRRGDDLLMQQRYFEAFQLYRQLAVQSPDDPLVQFRIGMVETIRGEYENATRTLAGAIGNGLSGTELELARLYQGQVSAARGLQNEASGFWQTIGNASPLLAMRQTLEAEMWLRAGDYAAAENGFRQIALNCLPETWQRVVQTRSATLLASHDPATALTQLEHLTLAPTPTTLGALTPLVAPLLPRAQPDAAQLQATLQADPSQRPQLLGQLYLNSGFYTLAEEQFALVDPDGDLAHDAAAYAAYTRWMQGDQSGGKQRLEALVAANPDELRARALLALAYLAGDDSQRAQQQLDAIQQLAPYAPETYLAWGQWYAAQSDYLTAALMYQHAIQAAPPTERGPYALAAAEFALDTELDLCTTGQSAANSAVQLLPQDTRPLLALANIELRCGNPTAAHDSALKARELAPDDAEVAYVLGRVLASLGDRSAARQALIAAADLAPASDWRARAEDQLQVLGL